jgi:CTP synthase
MRSLKKSVRIGIVGKYVELHDAYMSVKEALFHAAAVQDSNIEVEWIYSGDLEKDKGWDQIASVDGIVVPGGFGDRGIEGKVLAARYARERKIPYFGLCLGMQVMCIEFARHVLDLETANSTEFDKTDDPVIDLMLEQRGITDMGGTMRLGMYPCDLAPDSVAARAYKQVRIQERHRHRFEFNNLYRARFEKAGMLFSGVSPDGQLVEIAELRNHPFMLGSQFHPEFLSRPNRPHPLFEAFVAASLENRKHPQSEIPLHRVEAQTDDVLSR